MHRRGWVVGAAMIALVLTGWSNATFRTFRVIEPESQAKAGTTSVAVVAVERWDDIVGDLSPEFTLSGNEAVAKVLPTTQVTSDRINSAFGAAVGIQTPIATLTRSEGFEQADGVPRTNEVKTSQEGETLAAATAPQLDALAGRKAGDLTVLDGGDQRLENNPVLQYQTALALFQEVKLLNRYVKSAARRHGFEPYLVRLQVGLTPYAPRQPYDVVTRIGFFVNHDEADDPCGTAGFTGQSAESCKASAKLSPVAIPLLVTDDFELGDQARVVDVVSQLAASAAGNLQGANIDAQLRSLKEQLQSIAGRTANSLVSVKRLSDNTIQARFGAAYDPSVAGCYLWELWCQSADRSMINRNYSVSLLLLVPEAAAATLNKSSMQIVAHTDMYDVRDGRRLAQTADAEDAFNDIVDAYSNNLLPLREIGEWRYNEIFPILAATALNERDSVIKALCITETCGLEQKSGNDLSLSLPKLVFNAMWIELATLASSYEFAVTSFDLPMYRQPHLPERQLALLLDDPSKSSVVRLSGAQGLDPDRLGATLWVHRQATRQGRASAAGPYPLRHTTIETSGSGRDVALSFPSLVKLGLVDETDRLELELRRTGDPNYRSGPSVRACTSPTDGTDASLTIDEAAGIETAARLAASAPASRFDCDSSCSSCLYTVMHRIEAAADAKPAKVRSIAPQIVVKKDQAAGELRFAVDVDKSQTGPVTVVVGGAQITSSTPAGFDNGKNAVTIVGDPGSTKTVDLVLTNLKTGGKVKLTPELKRGTVSLGVGDAVEVDVMS